MPRLSEGARAAGGSERGPSRLVRRITQRRLVAWFRKAKAARSQVPHVERAQRRVLEEDVGRCAAFHAGFGSEGCRAQVSVESASASRDRAPTTGVVSSPGTRICGRSERAKAPLTPEPHVGAARTSCMRQGRGGAGSFLETLLPLPFFSPPRPVTGSAPVPGSTKSVEFSFRLCSWGSARRFRGASRFLAELSPPIRTLRPWTSSWQCSRASTDAGRP